MILSIALGITSAAIAVYSSYKTIPVCCNAASRDVALRYVKSSRKSNILTDLDDTPDNLFVDCFIDGIVVDQPLEVGEVTISPPGTRVLAIHTFGRGLAEQGHQSPTPTSMEVGGTLSGGVSISKEPIEVKLHRRQRKGARHAIRSHVIAACKVEFGVPIRNAANLAAVRRYSGRVFKEAGVRPTHTRQHLPFVLEAVFVPDKYEVESKILASTMQVRMRKFVHWWFTPPGEASL